MTAEREALSAPTANVAEVEEHVTSSLGERAGGRPSELGAHERGDMDDLTLRRRRDGARRHRAAPGCGGAQGRRSGEADLFGRQDSRRREPARLVPRRRLRHPRPDRRSLDALDGRSLRRRPQARLLSLAGVPHRPAAVRRHDQSRRGRADGRGAARARRRPDANCARSSRTRRSATAASAGSPPASWTAWRRCGSPRTATASATTTGCSARSSATAGSRRRRRTGSPTATRGNSSGPKSITPSASAAGWK